MISIGQEAWILEHLLDQAELGQEREALLLVVDHAHGLRLGQPIGEVA